MNNDLIHFNERRKMCFDKIEQRKAEMRLQYKLFYISIAR